MATSASYASATIGTNSTSSSPQMDCNHPYYLHPSDSPGMQLTSLILTENNYTQWQRSMEIALSSKLKLGFVDGTYVRPATTSLLLAFWNRCNNMVISWILNAVSVDIRNSIVYIKSAREIWIDLEVRFAQSNVPKLFYLRKEISHLTQGTKKHFSVFHKIQNSS